MYTMSSVIYRTLTHNNSTYIENSCIKLYFVMTIMQIKALHIDLINTVFHIYLVKNKVITVRRIVNHV